MVSDGHKERFNPNEKNKKDITRGKVNSKKSHENTTWFNSKTSEHSSRLRVNTFPQHFSHSQDELKVEKKELKNIGADLLDK